MQRLKTIRLPRRGRLRVPAPGNHAGLTLVEIMVVITIIGLITGAVGFGVFQYLARAKVKTACQDISTLKGNITTYYATMNKFPNSLQDLVDEKLISKSSVPKDPWGNEYQYLAPTAGSDDFQVFSLGKDKQPGGTDENTDLYADKPPCAGE